MRVIAVVVLLPLHSLVTSNNKRKAKRRRKMVSSSKVHAVAVEKRVRKTQVGGDDAKFRVYEPKESPYIARIIHKQVQEYFHNGILDDIIRRHGNRNVTVFDVGSNIGMFALEIMRRTEGEANIFCFEPVPATYAVLDLNVKEAIDPANAFRQAGTKVKALPFGLSDSARTVTFSYRPHAPECSSMYDAQLLKGDRTTMTREEEIEHFTDKAYEPEFPLWKES